MQIKRGAACIFFSFLKQMHVTAMGTVHKFLRKKAVLLLAFIALNGVNSLVAGRRVVEMRPKYFAFVLGFTCVLCINDPSQVADGT